MTYDRKDNLFFQFLTACKEKNLPKALALIEATPHARDLDLITDRHYPPCFTALNVAACYLPEPALLKAIMDKVPPKKREEYVLHSAPDVHSYKYVTGFNNKYIPEVKEIAGHTAIDLLLKHSDERGMRAILAYFFYPEQQTEILLKLPVGRGNLANNRLQGNQSAEEFERLIGYLPDDTIRTRKINESSPQSRNNTPILSKLDHSVRSQHLNHVAVLHRLQATSLPGIDLSANNIGRLWSGQPGYDMIYDITAHLTFPALLCEMNADREFVKAADDKTRKRKRNHPDRRRFDQLWHDAFEATKEHFYPPGQSLWSTGIVESWHSQGNAFPDSLTPLKPLTDWQSLTEKPVIETPFVNAAGAPFFVRNLKSKHALQLESRQMRHCVGRGRYDEDCLSGETHIFSFRTVADGEQNVEHPISTLQLDISDKKKKGWRPLANTGKYFSEIEYKGPSNKIFGKDSQERKMCDWFLEGLEKGTIPLADVNKLGETEASREARKKSNIPLIVQRMGDWPTERFVEAAFQEYNQRHLRRAALWKQEDGTLKFNPDIHKNRFIKDVFVTAPDGTRIAIGWRDLDAKLWLKATGLEEKLHDIIRECYPKRAAALESRWKQEPDAWQCYSRKAAYRANFSRPPQRQRPASFVASVGLRDDTPRGRA